MKKTIMKSGKYFLVLLPMAFSNIQSAYAANIPFFTKYPYIDFNTWYVSSGWTDGPIQSCEWLNSAVTPEDNNIKITLSEKGGTKAIPYTCGEMHTDKVLGYGTYEASIKTAAGSGLNTAFFTYIGPGVGVKTHDEIDFEFLGKWPQTVQLNYWVNDKSMDGTIIKLGFNASEAFHTYGFTWEPSVIRWYVDGKVVHETVPGAVMPKTPGRLYMSLWSGSKLIDDWLGHFTYTEPVSAEYAWVAYTPIGTTR